MARRKREQGFDMGDVAGRKRRSTAKTKTAVAAAKVEREVGFYPVCPVGSTEVRIAEWDGQWWQTTGHLPGFPDRDFVQMGSRIDTAKLTTAQLAVSQSQPAARGLVCGFSVPLEEEEEQILRRVLKYSESIGDCELVRYSAKSVLRGNSEGRIVGIAFQDYEGVQAVLAKIVGIELSSPSGVLLRGEVVRRINAGVVVARERAAADDKLEGRR